MPSMGNLLSLGLDRGTLILIETTRWPKVWRLGIYIYIYIYLKKAHDIGIWWRWSTDQGCNLLWRPGFVDEGCRWESSTGGFFRCVHGQAIAWPFWKMIPVDCRPAGSWWVGLKLGICQDKCSSSTHSSWKHQCSHGGSPSSSSSSSSSPITHHHHHPHPPPHPPAALGPGCHDTSRQSPGAHGLLPRLWRATANPWPQQRGTDGVEQLGDGWACWIRW